MSPIMPKNVGSLQSDGYKLGVQVGGRLEVYDVRKLFHQPTSGAVDNLWKVSPSPKTRTLLTPHQGSFPIPRERSLCGRRRWKDPQAFPFCVIIDILQTNQKWVF